MSKEQVSNKSILDEHGRIVTARHILALVNFIAILAGTIITLVCMGKRGCPQAVATHVWILMVINIAQIAVCAVDFVTKKWLGIYWKWLPFVSYGVGGFWILTLVGEMVAGAAELGALRTDLVAIAIVQFVVALIAYLLWPMLDRMAIDAMIRPSVRNDGNKRKARSKTYFIGYIVVCATVIALQGVALLAYKIPPRPYDLFASSRAVKYELTEDETGYVVTDVYRGTSQELNIPATYNNLPVVGIKSGAIVEDALLYKYKVSDITFGDPVKADDGSYVYESNLEYIESGAITNDRITSITIPASVTRVGEGAIKSKSLNTITYQAAADFSIKSFECSALDEIVMKGDKVGNIVSLDGLSHDVTIEVEKDIYNKFRQNNMEYIHSFVPMIGEDEFCVDFYTDSDYYIDSIFAKKGTSVSLSYSDLKNNKLAGVSPVEDTLAYIRNRHELGTDGVKKESAFRGWYYNAARTEECVFSENSQVRFSENTTLYAKWIDEYTGVFDWGTYKPDGAVNKLYWTSEDTVKFPEVKNRIGYTEGVKWAVAGSSTYLSDSGTLNGSTTLYGTWILDKPQIDIEPNQDNQDGFTISQSKNEISFTYDENRTLSLGASYSHPLSGTIYSFAWSKNNVSLNNNTESAYAKNVADEGVYTLTVQAISPYGETSDASTAVTVNIARKALGIARYLTMADKTSAYGNNIQTVDVVGTLPANSKIKVSYEYKNAEGDIVSTSGVRNAGEYLVTAYYEKDNAADQANYMTESLRATFKITPVVLTVSGWTKSWTDTAYTTVYNGRSQSLTATINGVLSGDSVQIRYTDNVKTAAGSYTAVAADIYGTDAQNYSFAAVSQPWTIEKKVVTVSRWNTESAFTGNSVVYDGNEHKVSATLAGAENGEALAFTYADNGTNKTSASTVGTYSANIIGVSGATAQNYYFDTSASTARYEWVISPRSLTLTFSAYGTSVYDGSSNHGVTATVKNIVASDLSKFSDSSFNISATAGVNQNDGAAGSGNYNILFTSINAGTYTVDMNLKSTGSAVLENYTMAAGRQEYTIDRRSVSATIRTGYTSLTYNSNQFVYVDVSNIVSSDLNNVVLGDFTTSVSYGTDAANMANSGTKDNSVYRLAFRVKDVGSYNIEVTDFKNNNYTLTAFSGVSEVVKKEVYIENGNWRISADGVLSAIANNSSSTYTGTNQTVYVQTLSGVVSGETVQLTYSNNSYVNVGSYTTTAELPSTYTNYTLRTGSGTFNTRTWNITKAPISISWNFDRVPNETSSGMSTFYYDGSAVTVTPSFNSLNGDELELVYASGKNSLSGKNVQTYYIEATGFSGDKASNYEISAAGKTCTWRITPKALSIRWTATDAVTYDGQYHGPTLTISGFADTDDMSGKKVTVLTGETHEIVLSGNQSSYTINLGTSECGFIDAGSYYPMVTAINDSNYTIGTQQSTNFVVKKKALSLSAWSYQSAGDSGVYAENSNGVTYNGGQYTLSTNPVGVVTRADNKTETVTLSILDNKSTNVGTKTAYVQTGTYSTNYEVLETAEGRTIAWRISPKSVTLTWDSAKKTYSARVQTISVTGATGLCSGDTLATLSLTYTNASGTDAATYSTSVTCGNGNYAIANPTFTWKIDPKPVELNWSGTSYVYNGNVQLPTASYTLNGVTVNVRTYSGDTTARNANDGYTITATALDNGNFTLTGGSSLSCTFKIEPRVIILSWSETNVTYYKGRSYTANVSISNVAGTDNVSLVYTTTLNGTTVSNTVTDVGNYNVSVTGLSGTAKDNYTLTGTSNLAYTQLINIAQQRVVVTWTGGGTVTYDGKDHALSAVAKGASDNSTVAISAYSANLTYKNVGSYTVSLSSLADSNYYYDSTTSNISTTLTIVKCVVTATWKIDGRTVSGSSTAVAYDGTNHTLTAEIVNPPVPVTVIYEDGGNAWTDSGNHTCTVRLSDSTNFTLSNSQYVLNITKIKANVVWKDNEVAMSGQTRTIVFDGNRHVLKAEVTGLLDCDKNDYTLAYSGSSDNGEYGVGTYTRSVTVTTTNYYFDTNELRSTLTITAKPVSVNWIGAGEFTYDGTTHTVSAIARDSGGYTVSGILTVTGTASASAAGEYTLMATLNSAEGANYKFANGGNSASTTLKIKPLTVVLAWSGDTEVYYDGAFHALSVSITNVCSGDTVNCTYTLTRNGQSIGSPSEAGVYVYTVDRLTGASAANYTLEGVSNLKNTLTIKQSALQVSGSCLNQTAGTETSTIKEAVEINVTNSGSSDVTVIWTLMKDGEEYRDPLLTEGTYTVVLTGLSGARATNFTYVEGSEILTFEVVPVTEPEPEPEPSPEPEEEV